MAGHNLYEPLALKTEKLTDWHPSNELSCLPCFWELTQNLFFVGHSHKTQIYAFFSIFPISLSIFNASFIDFYVSNFQMLLFLGTWPNSQAIHYCQQLIAFLQTLLPLHKVFDWVCSSPWPLGGFIFVPILQTTMNWFVKWQHWLTLIYAANPSVT